MGFVSQNRKGFRCELGSSRFILTLATPLLECINYVHPEWKWHVETRSCQQRRPVKNPQTLSFYLH